MSKPHTSGLNCGFLYTIATWKKVPRVKVHSNECPPWSELGIANQVHLWNLKSTAYLSEVRNFVLQNGFAQTDIVYVAIIAMHQLLMVACCRLSVVHHH